MPMNDVPFRYCSFSVDGYRELLEANGLALIRCPSRYRAERLLSRGEESPDRLGNSYGVSGMV
jgi:hypothetical protein